mgnify:FL=1
MKKEYKIPTFNDDFKNELNLANCFCTIWFWIFSNLHKVNHDPIKEQVWIIVLYPNKELNYI